MNKYLQLLASRMGYHSQPAFNGSSVAGINQMNVILNQRGGNPQQDRMIKDKRNTLNRAVLYSYQGAFVKKVYNEDNQSFYDELNQPPVRALINPDKVKQDYDDKIISIGFEHGFQPGDVFEWCNTNTHWLIYLRDIDELAYFKGEIRRCRYQISWLDEDGKPHSTYAAIRGPVETKIDYIQKHGISVDNPNMSLSILMPLNNATRNYFKRYSKFYLQDQDVCWRVEAIDWISTEGILQVNATEYYANETEDDIANGLVGGLVIKDAEVNTPRIDRLIDGETFIKPKREYTYTYTGISQGGDQWSIDSSLPIEYTINENTVTLKWLPSYSGQFTIKYLDLEKTIVVESLF